MPFLRLSLVSSRIALAAWLAGFSASAQEFRITAVELLNPDIQINWNAPGGSNYVVQSGGWLAPDGWTHFTDLSPVIPIPGSGSFATGYTHVGGALASTSVFYRVRSFPLAPPAGTNDNFANRIGLAGTQVTATGDNSAATKESGEPDHTGNAGGKSLWWSWTAPADGLVTISTCGSQFDTLLEVYTGTAVDALLSVADSDDNDACGTVSVQSLVQFAALAGTTYQIAVDGYVAESGAVALELTLTAAQPNDNFADRLALTGGTVMVFADSTLATRETGEPAHAGNIGGRSLWWSWTASADATITISTCGSGFDTLLAVYTGTAVDALTPVAASDDSDLCSPGAFQSEFQFVATAGTTYQIAVAGFDGEAGFLVLKLSDSPPGPNDDFADRLELTGNQLSTGGNNAAATKEPGEPDHAGNAGGRSLWWTWTAPANGTLIIHTCDSGIDTLLAVYTGTAVDALALVAASDDSNACGVGSVRSEVQIEVAAGTTYQIAVDGYDGEGGAIYFDLSFAP